MLYKVKIWFEDDKIKCCSQVCGQDCPRWHECRDAEIEILALEEA